MCLALKTSKIRYKHFKDTKATNAFIYLCIYLTILAFIYWYYIFSLPEQNTDKLLASDGILYTVHSTIIMLTQILLFVPKVHPPLKRRLANSKMKSK